jgi:hypothetical protein
MAWLFFFQEFISITQVSTQSSDSSLNRNSNQIFCEIKADPGP